MYYMTIPEAAVRWKMVPREVRQACERSAITGAFRLQRRWFIPEDALRPGGEGFSPYGPSFPS